MTTILVLDTSALIHSGFHALENLRNSKGEPIGAIKSFVKQLDKLINMFCPDYIISAQDVKRSELKRKEIYPEYKENRKSSSNDLIFQIKPIEDILMAYGIKTIKMTGYEADDIVASIVNKYSSEYKIVICTKDKDLAQLVSDNVSIFLLGKSIYIQNDHDVIENFGVTSDKIKELFALTGDTSDGIPGIKGIGKVGGTELINEYGTLENIYENISNIKKGLQTKLIENKEIAFLSRKLVSLYDNLDLNLDINECKLVKKDIKSLKNIYIRFELKEEFEKLFQENKEDFEIKIENQICESYNEFICILNSQKSNISLYYGKEGISFYNGSKVYYYIKEQEENIFSENIDLNLISKDLDVTLYSAKFWLSADVNFKNYFDILLANYSIETNRIQKIETTIFDNLNILVPELNKKNDENYSNRLILLSYGIYMLKDILEKELDLNNKQDIYYEEKEFTKILVYMEKNGISLDVEYFKSYLNELTNVKQSLEEKIYKEAGERFNISSPKQLANILFDKLNIEPVKKNKSGNSTDAKVLEMLELRGIEIAKYLIEYREIEKLRTTYLESFLSLVKQGKIYTTFNQTGTITGRLSSQDPNLQNIPTRTEIGNKIRKGFIAQKGKKLVSFDYSQIELRVLAYLSKDEKLIESYKKDLDLHELTARKLFNLSSEETVSKNQRNIGKVINFSVLYGKTAYGLSQELKIPISDAKEYIDKYFMQYPKVKDFLEKTVEFAKENNYVETIYGMRRYVYDINSKNLNIMEQSKRMAINTVVQGSAANIIKKVMKEIYYNICNDKVKMLLQVHDELIFEIDDDSLDICESIKVMMENTIKFEDVKFKVNYSIGDNWAQLK